MLILDPRELSGQFKTLITEEDKNRKKLQKKEQLEKAKSEAQKLAQVLEIQVRLFRSFGCSGGMSIASLDYR
jgi:hypothetical protein